MNQLELKNYNLEATLMGGQAFNWDFVDGTYYGFTQDKLILLRPARNKKVKNSEETTKVNTQTIEWQTYPNNNDDEFLQNYLGLSIDYDAIIKNIQKDEHIKKAIQSIDSVRILNQDFEQTLLSFLLTSHKNIKAVRKLVRDLAKRYGEKVTFEGKEFYLFPTTEVLAQLSEEELRSVGAGFRAKYLKSAAQKLQNSKLDLSTNEDAARSQLLEFTGIGDKIADCIMAFSLGFTSVTPLDIWGKRVLTDLYGVDPKMNYSDMRKWYRDYFGEYTVWAGQFLFEYYRKEYNNLK